MFLYSFWTTTGPIYFLWQWQWYSGRIWLVEWCTAGNTQTVFRLILVWSFIFCHSINRMLLHFFFLIVHLKAWVPQCSTNCCKHWSPSTRGKPAMYVFMVHDNLFEIYKNSIVILFRLQFLDHHRPNSIFLATKLKEDLIGPVVHSR